MSALAAGPRGAETGLRSKQWSVAIMSFYDWYCDLPPASPQVWGEQTDVPESADSGTSVCSPQIWGLAGGRSQYQS